MESKHKEKVKDALKRLHARLFRDSYYGNKAEDTSDKYDEFNKNTRNNVMEMVAYDEFQRKNKTLFNINSDNLKSIKIDEMITIFKCEFEKSPQKKEVNQLINKERDNITDQFKTIKDILDVCVPKDEWQKPFKVSEEYVVILLTFILYQEKLLDIEPLETANTILGFLGYDQVYPRYPSEICRLQAFKRIANEMQQGKDINAKEHFIEYLAISLAYSCFVNELEQIEATILKEAMINNWNITETNKERKCRLGEHISGDDLEEERLSGLKATFKERKPIKVTLIKGSSDAILTKEAWEKEPVSKNISNEQLWLYITDGKNIKWFARFRNTLKTKLKGKIKDLKPTIKEYYDIFTEHARNHFSIYSYGNLNRKLFKENSEADIDKTYFLWIYLYIYYANLQECTDANFKEISEPTRLFKEIDAFVADFYSFSVSLEDDDLVCPNYRKLIEEIQKIFSLFKNKEEYALGNNILSLIKFYNQKKVYDFFDHIDADLGEIFKRSELKDTLKDLPGLYKNINIKKDELKEKEKHISTIKLVSDKGNLCLSSYLGVTILSDKQCEYIKNTLFVWEVEKYLFLSKAKLSRANN